MGAELLVARARGRRGVYRLQDALADLGCGVGQQVVVVLVGAALLVPYALLYRRFRLVTFAPGSAWPWLVAFLAVDLGYYWWHRLSHRVNLLWAAHAVHHQSEDYNLAVALRQSMLTTVTSLPFYWPMAVLGVPTAVYAAMVAASTLYQFWIHTELVGRLGWLERFLNTPSHHRVHHAVNTRYLDRNYGAVLIVWDRLFGTYEEEREPARYGTTKPFGSFNPAWAQLQPWFEIAERARGLRRRRDRLLIWLRSPSWLPDGVAAVPEAEILGRGKFSVDVPARHRTYALVQFAPLIAATFALLYLHEGAPLGWIVGVAGQMLLALISLGALLDGRRWGVPLELARLALLGAAVLVWRPAGPWGWAVAAAAVALLAVWLLPASRGGRMGRAAESRVA